MIEPINFNFLTCWCITCTEFRHLLRPYSFGFGYFIVCPDCGNKRCPKATNHDHACTNSNAADQPGSVY